MIFFVRTVDTLGTHDAGRHHYRLHPSSSSEEYLQQHGQQEQFRITRTSTTQDTRNKHQTHGCCKTTRVRHGTKNLLPNALKPRLRPPLKTNINP